MQLIKRTTLLYQEASSDKVYEVDLCQTGQNRYLVNFRYGRRGSNLKEGTKTTQAVPLAEAERVFDKLVREKVNKGYRDTTNQPTTTTPAPTTTRTDVTPTSSDPRHQAILNRLANRDNSKWSLDRVIWRAGELKIKEATPLLIQLLGTGEPLRDYCIAWALGWCGGKGTISTLIRLYQSASSPDFVSRIAYDALLKLSDAQTKAGLQAQMIDFLPAQLQQLARNGSAQDFSTALKTYLDSSDYKRFAVLDTIYQIDNEYVRPALLDILCEAPLKPNYFKQIRHIFKIAEYRHDSEIFGMLAYAFEKESGNYDSDGYGVRLPGGEYLSKQNRRYNYTTRQWDTLGISEFEAEMRKPNPRLAYTKQTREYLRKRVWRTLKQLGEEGDREYVKMAVDFLLQFSDRDAQQVRDTSVYRWNQQSRSYGYLTTSWDTYAPYLAFNHILYENSPRYVSHPKAWQCKEGYKPGDPEPNVREEAFPELWQKHPEALLQLLLESECRPVHHFAVKAIRVSTEYCDRLDINTLILLLNKPYEITVEFAFSLAVTHYNPATPDRVLVLTVANCISQNARTQAYRWIEAQREYFFTSSEFIANLVTSEQADTRAFARRLLSSSILDDTTAKVLIGRIIAAVLALEPTQTDMAREMGETLLVSFTPQLRNLGLGIILDLLKHPMPEIQELGARILLNHETKAVDLPPDLIESLLASPHESVRGIGVRIFGQLPDQKLLSDRTLITAMAINPVTDIRNAIRPGIRRLANNNTDFASAIATDLIDVLIIPEKHEGVHKDVVQLLKEDIPNWISGISKDKTMQLIRAKSSAAQELAGLVLQENSDRFLPEFQISEIVKLANHEILTIREAARQMFVKNLNHIRTNSQAMLSAVRLLESKWEDSRQFATTIFNNNFTPQDWTPEVIVSICDSIREEVRTFGRDLVTRHFQQSYGQEYLLKFSEHPSADMQMFATNYLENYAVDNPQRLQQLTPYFISILSSVNRGRVAKQRIFAFLETEAQKSEQAAHIVAQILTQQSLTIAIGDKATTIKLMLLIHKTYPQISLPLHIKPVTEIRN